MEIMEVYVVMVPSDLQTATRPQDFRTVNPEYYLLNVQIIRDHSSHLEVTNGFVCDSAEIRSFLSPFDANIDIFMVWLGCTASCLQPPAARHRSGGVMVWACFLEWTINYVP